MAPLKEQRIQPRSSTRIPSEITCISCKTVEPFHATIFNMSGDGLYLESDHDLKAGDDVLIHTSRQDLQETSVSIEIDNNTGVVTWSRAMERNGRPLWGAGIRFSYPELMESFARQEELLYYCDLCSKAIDAKGIRYRSDPLWMCPRCNEQINGLPNALYRLTVRFLIGNAL